jgi:hypothetical protein
MLLPLSDTELIDPTLWWSNSWSCEIDLDLKWWGEWPTSEFCICFANGDVPSTLSLSKLQSLCWLIGTYMSTQDKSSAMIILWQSSENLWSTEIDMDTRHRHVDTDKILRKWIDWI